MSRGSLTLVGTPIGNLGDLSPRALQALALADVIAAEDTRRTRTLLSAAGIPAGGRLFSLHARSDEAVVNKLVERLVAGSNGAYVTDAGMPGISDPGENLVRACISEGVPVSVVPGPSAVLLALVLSGLSTTRFAFEGFLPRRGRERSERLRQLAAERRTMILFEAPRRVRSTLADLAAHLGGERRVAVARELTKRFEGVWRGQLAEAAADEGERRGEHVIVLEGAPPPPPPGPEELEKVLRAELEAGSSVRDAAAAAVGVLGVSKRAAYELARTLRDDQG
ncbi:MAG: 16S rRNA (cytidine(1402)-2'-O)-methyltransferase [Acidimicrobiia bacterium]